MKVRLLFGLCLILMLVACNENNLLHPRPSDILSSDQMIPLLVDIHLTDAAVKLNQSAQEASAINLYYSKAFAPVFKKYNTTPVAFDNSMKWYARHIDQLGDIYTEVITRLSTLESETRIKVKPNKPGGGSNNPFYPETEKSEYLPDSLRAFQIPYALSFR